MKLVELTGITSLAIGLISLNVYETHHINGNEHESHLSSLVSSQEDNSKEFHDPLILDVDVFTFRNNETYFKNQE